jgi:cobyrinic acid a,c-diamide synthase
LRPQWRTRRWSNPGEAEERLALVMARGLIIAAPRSGCGKTTVTVALTAALARRGIAVAAAKAGPDYIDPAFHAAASGRTSLNLDSWAMPPPLLDALVKDAGTNVDILLIEGVMGLFDGLPGPSGRSGATSDLAERYALPVLLVLDVSGQSQSAAAVVRGFASHDPRVHIGGVLLNRLGSERHRRLAAESIEALGLPVLGALPRDPKLTVPERHLGLVQASEHANLDGIVARLAEVAERDFDIEGILAVAAPLDPVKADEAMALPPPGQRIALASDEAFTFNYPHLVNGWRRAGAEIVTFSPLTNEGPPEDCDICWLGGGYPELHAGTLGVADRFFSGLAKFAETRPVHGECGGFMVLGQGIEDQNGTRHAMAGLLGHATSFAKRKLHLGYREARLLRESPIGSRGTVLRGHEFHYASLISPGTDPPIAELFDGNGSSLGGAGAQRGHVTGTFFHAIAQQP